MKRIGAGIVLLLLAVPLASFAQSADQSGQVEQEYLEKATVVSASASTEQAVPATGVTEKSQTLTVRVLSGPDTGATPTFENDFTQLSAGDTVYVRHSTGGDAVDTWSVSDPYRIPILLEVGAAFLLLLFAFGGMQGVRGLVSLAGSIALIFYALLPMLYAGWSPVLVSIGVASLIIIVGSYVTHGFNRTTTVAMLGMLATVIITGTATWFVIHAAALSGFTSEDNVYLNFNTAGSISMTGLLFGGMVIGFLGILYDIAIGQAIAVEELLHAGVTQAGVFRRAMRIGREHIGALVNTLAIAYVGASLPLLLLFKQSSAGIVYVLNSERFATEIIRILMGSIGLILAVPLTTALATLLLKAGSHAPAHGHSHG